MTDSTLRVCAREIAEIAGSLASIRGLLENPDDPLLPNHLAVIEPALLQLERQLVGIAELLQKQE